MTALRALLDTLPAETLVPVSWVRLVLAEGPAPTTAPTAPAPDLTVPQVAERFGRKASTVREWCEHRYFPGAYKLREREWRVPLAGVQAFEDAERRRAPSAARPRQTRARSTAFERLVPERSPR